MTASKRNPLETTIKTMCSSPALLSPAHLCRFLQRNQDLSRILRQSYNYSLLHINFSLSMVLHPYLMTCRFAALYSNDKLEPGDSIRAAKELLEDSSGNKCNIPMLCVFAAVKTNSFLPITKPLSQFLLSETTHPLSLSPPLTYTNVYTQVK